MHDLERHPALERLVLGLVDDPHAARADDAEDLVVAQPLGMRVARASGRPLARRAGCSDRAGGHLDARLELLHLDQGREQLADLVGPLGAASRRIPPGWAARPAAAAPGTTRPVARPDRVPDPVLSLIIGIPRFRPAAPPGSP